MKLHTLRPAVGSVRGTKRIGRGEGSGRGGTATRGHKGAQSRSGYKRRAGFEGGQLPLQRRLPKFGFTPPRGKVVKVLNVDSLQALATKWGKDRLDIATFHAHRVLRRGQYLKVLGRGKLKKGLVVEAHYFSASAIKALGKDQVLVAALKS